MEKIEIRFQNGLDLLRMPDDWWLKHVFVDASSNRKKEDLDVPEVKAPDT